MSQLSLTTVLSIATTNPFSLAFLEANADAAGVRVLPSGLQYRVLEHGDGHESPVHDTAVEINWEGYTATAFNATPRDAPFYSTYAGDGPMPLTPQEGVSAWEEALQLMTEGDKWEIVAPSQLGYGEEGMEGMVPPGEALVYILELVKIEGDNAGPRREAGPEVRLAEEALEQWEGLEGDGVGVARLRGAREAGAWVRAEGRQPLVLALLRRPLSGVLLAAFLASAAAHAGARAAYALSAESTYVPSAVETQLALRAPAVFVSRDGGASWARCSALLEAPSWSHAPPTLVTPRTDADGKPLPPDGDLVRAALDECVLGEGGDAPGKDEL